MRDYSKYPKKRADPKAPDMIDSFRAIGYNTETAIADILDNSISADAKNIWIDFEWRGNDSIAKKEECWLAMRHPSFRVDLANITGD